MKRLVIFFSVILLFMLPNCSIAKDFSDVSSGHWAYSYIDTLSNNGVINGYSNGTFNPNATIKMAEYIKLLVCTVATEDEQTSLQNDMKNYSNWYEPYVKYANDKGIIDEKLKEKELTSTVSREKMAKLLANFVSFADYDSSELISLKEGDCDIIPPDGLDTLVKSESHSTSTVEIQSESNDESEKKLEFSDVGKLKAESQDSIYYLVDLGLISGYEDKTFRPQKDLTRAEVSTIIYRFGKMINAINYKYHYEEADDTEFEDDEDDVIEEIEGYAEFGEISFGSDDYFDSVPDLDILGDDIEEE